MKTANSKSVKTVNTKLVLENLISFRETTRVDLSRVTTLNKATVSSIIKELIDKKFVIETQKSIKTSGRSANVIALNKNAGRIFSIELLPTECYAIITNLYGEVVYEIHHSIVNPEFDSYLSELLHVISVLKDNVHDSVYGVIGIGIGVYGILSKDKTIKFATFNSWKDIDLTKILEEKTNLKVYVENEANISVMGEKIMYPRDNNILSITIGAGVGMGIVINHSLFTGEDGYAGEIGHNILIPHGKQCVCGNKGCLEQYISDSALIEQYLQTTSKLISIEDLIKKIENKDAVSLKIYQDFIDYLAIAINNVAHTINPKTIVINSRIIENVPNSISLIEEKLQSKILNIDLLTTSRFKKKTNVLGLTHLLIQDFFDIKNYNPKA